MKPVIVVLFGLCSLACRAAYAGPSNLHSVEVLSEGASTCGEFIAEPELQTTRMEWVLGYISGVNSRSPESLAGSSFEKTDTVVGWLQSYCSSHPLDILAQAAEELRRDFLARERQSVPSDAPKTR